MKEENLENQSKKVIEETSKKDEESIMKDKESKKKKYKIKFSFFKTLKGKILLIIISIILILIACISLNFINIKPKANCKYLNQILEKSSELTSVKLTITGVEKYKDAGAKIINRADFTMVYKATVRAGVDLNEVEVTSNDITKEILINMPKAKIFDCHVDQKNIDYYDEKLALFNVDSKEDANKACALAEEDGIKEASETGILEFAEKEAEYVIKDILKPGIPKGYKLIIKHK